MLVTCRVSHLQPELLQSVESIIVTQTTDPREADALTTVFGRAGDEAQWESLLGGLKTDEAALLPSVGGRDRNLRRFKVAKRLTPHVRSFAEFIPEGNLER